MSYNPAFVFEETLETSDTSNGQSNGIKLTSFKQLKAASDNQNQNIQTKKDKVNSSKHKENARKKQSKSPIQKTISNNLSKDQSNNFNSNKDLQTNDANNSSNQQQQIATSQLIDLNTSHQQLASLTPSASSYATTISSTSSTGSYTSSSNSCAAVECRDLMYDVGRGKNHKTILYNINVTIPEGSM